MGLFVYYMKYKNAFFMGKYSFYSVYGVIVRVFSMVIICSYVRILYLEISKVSYLGIFFNKRDWEINFEIENKGWGNVGGNLFFE